MKLKELKDFQMYQYANNLYLNNVKLKTDDWNQYDEYEVEDIVAYTDEFDGPEIDIYIKDKEI